MMTQTFTFLNDRYTDDKNTFGPRVYFNHGYHDAVLEASQKRARELSETIHDTRHVSSGFDRMYFEGYKAGLAETKYTGNSELAWINYRDSILTNDQLREVFQAEVIAYQATWNKRDRNDYILAEARKEAGRVCGVR